MVQKRMTRDLGMARQHALLRQRGIDVASTWLWGGCRGKMVLFDKGLGMKKISKQMVRTKSVANVLASLRIERLTPSRFVVKGMQDCLDGQTSTSALLLDVMQRHAAVGRN